MRTDYATDSAPPCLCGSRMVGYTVDPPEHGTSVALVTPTCAACLRTRRSFYVGTDEEVTAKRLRELHHALPYVVRWVITHLDPKAGMRGLTFPKQGRHTYPDEESARAALEEFKKPHGLPRVMPPAVLATLEVRACECWAGHFDPVGYWFD